jgi:Lon-like protease
VNHPGLDTGTPPLGGDTGLRRRRRGPSLWRAAFYAASAAVIAWASLVVPLPFIEHVPSEPTEISPLIEIEGVEVTELRGSTAMLTVLLRQQPTVPAIGALLAEHRRLVPIGEVFPPDVDREERLERERERFGRQFEVAAAVGAQAAGYDAELATEATVVDVMPGLPADGRLAPGDAILAVDGDPIIAAEELQVRAREGEIGQVLTLTVRRAGRELTIEVPLGETPELDHPIMGILVETAVDELRLPFELRLAEGVRIGGPSAGLLIAITVYDLLAEEDLLRGRIVMGTGTVDADGRVGTVGGVPEKVLAAARHDADLVLVPEFQLEDALTTAPDDLEVHGVETFEDALEVLRAGG